MLKNAIRENGTDGRMIQDEYGKLKRVVRKP